MIQKNIAIGSKISGFVVTNITDVPETSSTAYELKHEKTGARCIHLHNDDRNNLFSISFKTPVSDDTGVPHILEHSVLAGSKKYPLKDPFKEMLKGSMYTFLNALTYPDRTVYPVSSQVEKDYFNLVDVYCDAVFNPLLTENTFKQEGWHFNMEDPSSSVSIKGIVYNEMKGVFSDFHSNVARKMLSGIFPDTTYASESGGDPQFITDLTYNDFINFHKRYYHPSNSYIVLYGNIPTEKTLSYLEDNYLSNYNYLEVESEIAPQKPWSEPRAITIKAPSSKEDDGTSSVLLSWMLEGTLDGEEGLLCDIITRYFFNGESAPLKRALLDSELGEDLDDMCGYDNDLRCASFTAGLAKVDPEDALEVEKVILETIANCIKNGPDSEHLEGTLRRMEFSLREIKKGGSFPYPLRLTESIHRSWLYGGDPLSHLTFERHLSSIREKFSDTQFFAKTLQRLFIDNPHRLRMVTVASAEMGLQLGKQTEKQAEILSKDFTDEQKSEIYRGSMELLKEQQKSHTEEELSCIPMIDPEDIPRENEKTEIIEGKLLESPYYTAPLFTAGIYYLDISFNLAVLPTDLLNYFPLYARYLLKAGAGNYTTEEMAKRINLVTGGISSSDFFLPNIKGNYETVGYCTFHSKALYTNVSEMIELLRDIFTKAKFNDERLLKDLLFEDINDFSSTIVRSGNSYALLQASAHINQAKAIEERLDGISQYRFIRDLAKEVDFASILDAFSKIHKLLIKQRDTFIAVTGENTGKFDGELESLLADLPKDSSSTIAFEEPWGIQNPYAIEISSSVNYVTQSIPLLDFSPESVGEHYLLSRLLSTGFLWDKIRVEGGAYGGSAVFMPSSPLFSMSSYRDPNLTRTLNCFSDALKHGAGELRENDVKRAICGAIGKFDAPKNPHSAGISEAVSTFLGNTQERRQLVREAILNATVDKLAERSVDLLKQIDHSQIVVAASAAGVEGAQKEGFSLRSEQL